ncbi:hypothetical protein [Geodermatophilus sabuli]|uniref:hypothetical protein n=1 Tax=Geodermatophilus sabuli TaxID=1564158 RepID=UPI00117A2730|nr:hypothetical protein [Geodermatophilus sabuli]MBB3082937.1 hypothetical protein [Geodermatophilus sabuli]
MLGAVLFWLPVIGLVLGVLGTVFGALGIGAARAVRAPTGMAWAGLFLGMCAVGWSVMFMVILVTP